VGVKPSIVCGACGAPIASTDKFCAKCGTAIEWSDAPVLSDDVPSMPSTIICPSCGIPNLSTNAVCSGCGTQLAVGETTEKTASRKKTGDAQHREIKKRVTGARLESWKMLSIAGIVIAGVLVGIGIFRNPPKEVGSADQAQEANASTAVSPTLLSDIESLQKDADANPKNPETLLHLANALHDAKFLPRAIATYKKYLELKPADPDARVDMGICYYESGDSPTALKEMQTALKYDPKHQMAMFNLGIVTLNQGNLALSNEWFKKAVAVDPNTQVGQRAQQILTQHSTIQQ